jgi:hypothetical protein
MLGQSLLGHSSFNTKMVYVPYISLCGIKSDGWNKNGKVTFPKFITTSSLSGLNNILACSPS